MNPERDIGVLQRIRKAKIGGSIVDRVAAHDNQQINLARTHVRNQVAQGLGLVDRVCVDRVGIYNRLAYVAECLVDGVSERMDSGGLVVTRDDDAGTLVAL